MQVSHVAYHTLEFAQPADVMLAGGHAMQQAVLLSIQNCSNIVGLCHTSLSKLCPVGPQ